MLKECEQRTCRATGNNRESAKPNFSGSQVVNLSPIEYSWHRKHASINETVILFLRFLLVLSCLGQAADLVVSITRSSAVGIMLTPPKLERVPTWGSA